MKPKPAVGMIVLVVVAFFTWAVTTATAAAIFNDHEAYLAWRADNTTLFLGIWLAEVVVIGLPVLWFVGKRMGQVAEQQDKAALEARGVGRLAVEALHGNERAIAHLVKLLDDGSPAVRYQSARALAILDDKAANEELFRKVPYWDGDHKLALIDVLKRTMDLRTIKLLRELASDRNPMVARKARTALAIVSSRSGNIDDFIAKRRKQAQAKRKKEARKQARRAGGPAVAAAEPAAGPSAGPPVEPPPEPSSEPAAARPADGPTKSPAGSPAEPAAGATSD